MCLLIRRVVHAVICSHVVSKIRWLDAAKFQHTIIPTLEVIPPVRRESHRLPTPAKHRKRQDENDNLRSAIQCLVISKSAHPFTKKAELDWQVRCTYRAHDIVILDKPIRAVFSQVELGDISDHEVR